MYLGEGVQNHLVMALYLLCIQQEYSIGIMVKKNYHKLIESFLLHTHTCMKWWKWDKKKELIFIACAVIHSQMQWCRNENCWVNEEPDVNNVINVCSKRALKKIY